MQDVPEPSRCPGPPGAALGAALKGPGVSSVEPDTAAPGRRWTRRPGTRPACKLDSVSDQPLSADGPAVTTRPAPVGWSVSGVVLAAALITVCVAVGVSAALPGNTVLQLAGRDPGPLVTLGLPAVKGVVDLAGAVTVGWLIAAVLLSPPAVGGRFDTSGYRSAQAASLAATVWAVGALALVPLGYASAAGQSLGSSVGADQLINAVADYDIARAPLITALLAALVAVAARVVLRPATAAPVLVLAAVALLPIALAGHAAASSDHDYATDTMIYHLAGISVWIGGLVAFLGLARQRAAHLPLIARRYSTMALIAFVLVAVSGVGNALVRVPRMSDLVATDYGRLVVLKAVLLTVLGVFGYLQRRRSVAAIQRGDRRPLLRLAVFEIGVMAATIGVAVALARTAPPLPLPIALTDTVAGAGLRPVPAADPDDADLRRPLRPHPRHRCPRVRRSLRLGSGAAAPARDRVAAGAGGVVVRRLRGAAAVHLERAGRVRRRPVQLPHDRAHGPGHARADPVRAGRPDHAGAAGATRVPGRRGARCAGGRRRPDARPLAAGPDASARRLPAVRRQLLCGLLHFAVRLDDRVARRAPDHERALPDGRLPLLLGHHRRRSGAAAADAADRSWPCCSVRCRSTRSSGSR